MAQQVRPERDFSRGAILTHLGLSAVLRAKTALLGPLHHLTTKGGATHHLGERNGAQGIDWSDEDLEENEGLAGAEAAGHLRARGAGVGC